jgi:cation transport regulator ChaC
MITTTENPLHIEAMRRRMAACSKMQRGREYTPGDVATLSGCTVKLARATLKQLETLGIVQRCDTKHAAYRVL